MKRIISYYGALVHFKNMGPDDEMFDQNKGQYGAYGYLFARTDSELTFKKLIENYADEYRTGIIEISNMEKRPDFDGEGYYHYLGIYTDLSINCYSLTTENDFVEKTCHDPILIPIWRSATVIIKNCGKDDELFVDLSHAPSAKLYVMAKTTTEELFITLIENYVSDYHSEIIGIENLRVEKNVDNEEMAGSEHQYMGIYDNGCLEAVEEVGA